MLRKKLEEILSGHSTRDLLEPLEKLISELIEKFDPIAIFITGSLARSRFVRGLSDIDILVIAGYEVTGHGKFLLRAVKDVDVEITIYSVNELKEALERGNQFIAEALKHGIQVYGDLDLRIYEI